MSVCAAIAEVLSGSHNTLDAIFLAAGAPGPPPNMAHHTKWKTWLLTASRDPSVDILALVGDLIGEFMDLPPENAGEVYRQKRARLVNALKECGLQYFRGGRVLPNGETPQPAETSGKASEPKKPSSVEELLHAGKKGSGVFKDRAWLKRLPTPFSGSLFDQVDGCPNNRSPCRERITEQDHAAALCFACMNQLAEVLIFR